MDEEAKTEEATAKLQAAIEQVGFASFPRGVCGWGATTAVVPVGCDTYTHAGWDYVNAAASLRRRATMKSASDRVRYPRHTRRFEPYLP